MTWERACIGLPTIALSVAENQISIGEETSRCGRLVYLGECSSVTLHGIRTAFADILRDAGRRRNLSKCSLGFMDGLGVKRTAHSLLELI